MTAILRAETASGQSLEDPSETALFDMLSEMNLRHPFVIVDRFDEQPIGQHYIQVHLNEDMSCQVEYREGGPDRHFKAHVPGPFDTHGHEVVATVVRDWAFRRLEWREALDWQPVRMPG